MGSTIPPPGEEERAGRIRSKTGGLWEEDEAAVFYRSPREEERGLIRFPADGAGMGWRHPQGGGERMPPISETQGGGEGLRKSYLP
ncbi:hypothetical protein AP071_13765 [Rhodobacter capsulatus]|nr:hypothetical protein AP073_15930 [Rhodobacter capsulatus]KQB15745.1 hypothetical protein AP071_13765 [Rhodobacter capsulatus]